MASGLSNKLTGQIGEFLVCAELGRRLDLVATPFAGNVPAFDLLVADEHCRSIPIQVKAARGPQWLSPANNWINLEVVDSRQVDHGDRKLAHPNLIYVFVAIADKNAVQAEGAPKIAFLSSLNRTYRRSWPLLTGRIWKTAKFPGLVRVTLPLSTLA